MTHEQLCIRRLASLYGEECVDVRTCPHTVPDSWRTEELLVLFDDLLKIQVLEAGNDPYMHGMANGMILLRSLVSGEMPRYIEAPTEWLNDPCAQQDVKLGIADAHYMAYHAAKLKSVEELQRLPIEQLDRLAFGVTEGEQRLPLDQIQIRYQDDYDDARDYVTEHPEDYLEALETEPIEVALERGVYWLEDGHHRYVTAQLRGDTDILVDLTIKDNPVRVLAQQTASSARDHDAGPQELELERLFQKLLPGTQFANKVFAVGGYVRDQLQEREPADLDAVVELPYGAQRLAGFLLEHFEGSLQEPKPLTYAYPIWYMKFTEDVVYDGERYEVAGAELDLTDTQTVIDLGTEELTTEFGPISEDVLRRDYTVNMLYKDLTSGEILDPTGTGVTDIERGILRARPDADAMRNFREQPRQMMRLVRFMAQYGWEPDPGIEAALRASVEHLAELDEHGLQKEFGKLKSRGLLDEALPILREYGMLEPLRRAWRAAKQERD